jgi:Tfp pilus assembly protein PilX
MLKLIKRGAILLAIVILFLLLGFLVILSQRYILDKESSLNKYRLFTKGCFYEKT